MAASPLTEQELAAYCRRRQVNLSVWEGDLLFRVDDAVLAIWTAQSKPGGAAEVEADIEDPLAVRGLLAGIRERMG